MKDSLGIFLMRWRNRVVLPYIRGDVLDVGCGTNTLLKAYRQQCPDLKSVGVDVYPWEGVDQLILDAAKLPFEAGSFDTVCCIAALNHIPNRLEFLWEAHRILRPGGRCVLTMLPPAFSHFWHTLRAPWDADQHERGMVDGEVYGLSHNAIATLLRSAQFSLHSESSFMFGINGLYIAQPNT